METIDILGLNIFGKTPLQGFHANTLALHIAETHLHIDHPHKHDFYAVMLFTQGSGEHDIDFKTFPVLPGSLFIMEPGQTHFWRLSSDIDGFVFFHSRDFFQTFAFDWIFRESGLFDSITSPNYFPPDAALIENQTELFEKILSEYRNADAFSPVVLSSLANLLYVSLERRITVGANAEISGTTTYRKLFRTFGRLLDVNYKSQKSASFYADAIRISAKHLNRINQTLVGKTTSEIINDRVMLEAKRMLLYADVNLKQISYDLGFADYTYFSRSFKAATGLGPKEFSTKWRR